MKEKVIMLPIFIVFFVLISFVFVKSAYAFSTPEEARDSVLPVDHGYQYIVKGLTCWYYATSARPLYYDSTQHLRSLSGAQAAVYGTNSLTTNEWILRDETRVLISGIQIEYIKYANEDIINNDSGQIVFIKNWNTSGSEFPSWVQVKQLLGLPSVVEADNYKYIIVYQTTSYIIIASDSKMTITNNGGKYQVMSTGHTIREAYNVDTKEFEAVYSYESGIVMCQEDIFASMISKCKYRSHEYSGAQVLVKNMEWEGLQSVSIPLAYLQLGLRHSHPYYLYIEKPNTTIKYFAFSSKPFYVNSDTYIHKAEETAGYFKYNGTSWELPVTMSGYTKILDGITPSMVTYCNHNLYATNVESMNTSVSKVVNSSTSEVIIESNPIPGLEDEIIIYTYEYDASIENLKSLNMRKRSWYHGEIFGQPFAIGASKDIYEVLWQSPEVPGLRLEISVQSKFQDKTRRWAKQTYNRPWDGEFYIMPEDEKMEISMMALGKAILFNEWNDVDTGSWYNIPPTELYFRYVIIDSGQKKVKYGNWTRLDFRSGSNGVIEKVKDVVTTNETIDPDTGEVIYEDVPVEGNETEYIGELGGEIDESQSFNTAADTLDNALNSSITGLQSVGTWLGQVPELIGKLFTFLPPEYLLIIGLGITMCIILMIAGR